jgi:hypothetical protein
MKTKTKEKKREVKKLGVSEWNSGPLAKVPIYLAPQEIQNRLFCEARAASTS